MSLLSLFKKRSQHDLNKGPSPPHTYAQWSVWFEEFSCGGKDDDLLLLALDGHINWSHGLAVQFTQRAVHTLELRLEATRKMLQAALQKGRTEHDVTRAILNARQAFCLLARYASLPCWPAPLPQTLTDMITQTTMALQKSLLEGAEKDRTGRIAKALRDNPLDRTPPPAPPPENNSHAPSGRRILL